MRVAHKYSITRILESLSKTECSHVKDDVLKDIGEKLNIDFSKRMFSLG